MGASGDVDSRHSVVSEVTTVSAQSEMSEKEEGKSGGDADPSSEAKSRAEQEDSATSLLSYSELGPQQLEARVQELGRLLRADPAAISLIKKPKDLESVALRRFIRARDGDVSAAFDQMLSVLKWRQEHKVDLVLERDFEFVAQDRWGMAYWHGKDKFNRPILVIRSCRHDPTLFNTETTLRYLIWKLESKLMEEDVDNVALIFDCLNVNRHNLDMKLMRIMIPLMLNFYPERLGICLVYPTSQIMWILWKMVSKAFDEKTEQKFVFIRESKRDNKFLRLISTDQLQTRFGGTCEKEYGVAGLGLVPHETLTLTHGETHPTATKNSTNPKSPSLDECLGPAAFQNLDLGDDEDTMNPEVAMREHRGPLFEEDEEFQAFLKEREKEQDKFQLRLRYQVSRVSIDCPDDIDQSSVDSSVHETGVDIIPTRLGLGARATVSESDKSLRKRKRTAVKRFLLRNILRRTRKEGQQSALPQRLTSLDSALGASSDRSLLPSPSSLPSAPLTTKSSPPTSPLGRPSAIRRASLKLVSPRRLSGFGPPPPAPPASSQLLKEIKFIMEAGASMAKVPAEDPGRIQNSWSSCKASKFDVRNGPDYKRLKQKAPSGNAVYECVCCDVWSLESKRPHIASYMQLPALTTEQWQSRRKDLAPIPELLIVNMMIPSYSPSGPFTKKRVDGPGQSVVLFARLSQWAKNNLDDPAVQLWSRFVHAHDGDPFRERLKMITRLENQSEIALGRIERALMVKYNGTPWLVRPEYEFHKGRDYFEIDIDYHIFKYFVLSNALPLLARIHNAILDAALIIQAEKDQEMPERVLVCATIRNLVLRDAPVIDLVQMDKTRRYKTMDTENPPEFIDREGHVHTLASPPNLDEQTTVQHGQQKEEINAPMKENQAPDQLTLRKPPLSGGPEAKTETPATEQKTMTSSVFQGSAHPYLRSVTLRMHGLLGPFFSSFFVAFGLVALVILIVAAGRRSLRILQLASS